MNKWISRTLATILILQSFFFQSASTVRAEETDYPPQHMSLLISSVAILKTGSNFLLIGYWRLRCSRLKTLTQSQFSPEMAHLSDANIAMTEGCRGSSAQRWSLDDENGDEQLDLLFFFKIRDLNLTLSSTAATLMAHGSYASTVMHIVGTDSVR